MWWWHRFSPRVIYWSSERSCCPVSSQLCHFKGPVQPLPPEPNVDHSQLQQFHQPTRNPLWLGGNQMEKPQLISGLLSTSASPQGWRSGFPGSWEVADLTGASGRLALSSFRCLVWLPCFILWVKGTPFDKMRHAKFSKQRSPLPSPQTERILRLNFVL